MICRKLGDSLCLVQQHEHALLSGRLASHFGNARFDRPYPTDLVVRATSMHDCGWRGHDHSPTVDEHGAPHHVFMTPLDVAMKMWSNAGVDLEGEGEMVRLLVSLHVMGLSAIAAGNGIRTRREDFHLNQFQHTEIELQESLRKSLGYRVDIPLKLGLAVEDGDFREDELRRNLAILQGMDRLSLAICCETTPFDRLDPIPPRLESRATVVKFKKIGAWDLRVWPWPFDQETLRLTIPTRLIADRPFGDGELKREMERSGVVEREIRIISGE
jgi:hypothetical protein